MTRTEAAEARYPDDIADEAGQVSPIRRQGVIAHYGSLDAYRAYAVAHRASWQAEIDDPATDPALLPRLREDLANWDLDIAWVEAEIVAASVAS
jgi:hypothetical protein